jgi:predicted phosphoribosyltransferase
MLFADRYEAGKALARNLSEYAGKDAVVLALPRGGVPVGYEVAEALHVALDIFVVRKLGVPSHEELAMGALASGGVVVLNEGVVAALDISRDAIAEAIRREQPELERREREYREGRPAIPVEGRTAILVDDGLATGSSMRVAIRALHKNSPGAIVVAVPVASRSTCEQFAKEVDEVVCAETPEPFFAVGQWYRDFRQTSDEEVRELLRRAASIAAPKAA